MSVRLRRSHQRRERACAVAAVAAVAACALLSIGAVPSDDADGHRLVAILDHVQAEYLLVSAARR